MEDKTKRLKANTTLGAFGDEQVDAIFALLVFQRLCPRKFVLEDPFPYDELGDEEVEEMRATLTALMPLDTIVADLWDWDIHFEELTFGDSFFRVALGDEVNALAEAKILADDILGWIDEYGMDYAQESFEDDDFTAWIREESESFIRKWRLNIAKAFAQDEPPSE